MSAKSMDNHNRWRSVTVGFRMSPEENEMLNRKVALSGLTKQDYIISRLLDWDVKVVPNPRVYKALRNQMEEIYHELKNISEDGCNDELLETIRIVANTLNGIKGGNDYAKQENI